MENEKYSNYPLSISAILGLIEANDIAIPVTFSSISHLSLLHE